MKIFSSNSKVLLLALLVSSVGLSGCKLADQLYEPVEQIVEVEQQDGTYRTVTNVWWTPKYDKELQTAGEVIKAVDPTPISTIVVGVLSGIYALGASIFTRTKLRKAKTKELTYAKALVTHGDEAIKLIDQLAKDPEMKGKLLERFQEIQQRAGIWEDIKPFLDPVSEIEFLARQKFGK